MRDHMYFTLACAIMSALAIGLLARNEIFGAMTSTFIAVFTGIESISCFLEEKLKDLRYPSSDPDTSNDLEPN